MSKFKKEEEYPYKPEHLVTNKPVDEKKRKKFSFGYITDIFITEFPTETTNPYKNNYHKIK